MRAILLTPRQDMANGRIRGFEIYFSDGLNDWGKPAVKGELPDSDQVQTIRFPFAQTGRYLRLIVLSEWTEGGYASLAEIEVK